jgi:hypothetical protein
VDYESPEMLKVSNEMKERLAALDSYVAIRASYLANEIVWFGKVVALNEETFELAYLKEKAERREFSLYTVSKHFDTVNYSLIVYSDISFKQLENGDIRLEKDSLNEITLAATQLFQKSAILIMK